MRIVTWNVCDGFNRKFGHLERLDPDLAIIQEVRPGCLAFAGLSERSLWLGDEGQKGLAVIGYGGWKLSPAMSISERWFCPVIAHNGSQVLHIVAVWVDSSQECGPPTLSALAKLRDFVEAAPTIIAGDFNHCVAMDKRKSPGKRFSDVLKIFDELGLASAWHDHKQEEHGQETAATLYWTWNRDRQFHIDFLFRSRSIDVEQALLGTYEQYVPTKISDHVPLVVDLKI
ncbi:endonuclease/exonuclease/phosphatase family protein [Microvirga splendida]|uniref:Endonuclease/exonuclease/phosphatase family protein n=1 Tax=Microvirga splendida TaxID=2795727 RepID=A0ABS0Y2P7_9HYPH|nr:endonuclease/exonuclease/phosphatase family protein [Microvirga splendida]MBJ6126580.1 endonuclease/exonuclease/phosphatase family protein [Microvirga splendida]